MVPTYKAAKAGQASQGLPWYQRGRPDSEVENVLQIFDCGFFAGWQVLLRFDEAKMPKSKALALRRNFGYSLNGTRLKRGPSAI